MYKIPYEFLITDHELKTTTTYKKCDLPVEINYDDLVSFFGNPSIERDKDNCIDWWFEFYDGCKYGLSLNKKSKYIHIRGNDRSKLYRMFRSSIIEIIKYCKEIKKLNNKYFEIENKLDKDLLNENALLKKQNNNLINKINKIKKILK